MKVCTHGAFFCATPLENQAACTMTRRPTQSHYSDTELNKQWCPLCGKVHIKDPLLLIGKSSLCADSGLPLKKYVTMSIRLTSNSQWYENHYDLEVLLNQTNFPFFSELNSHCPMLLILSTRVGGYKHQFQKFPVYSTRNWSQPEFQWSIKLPFVGVR